MNTTIIVAVVIFIVILIALGFAFVQLGGSDKSNSNESLRNLIQNQKGEKGKFENTPKNKSKELDKGSAALLAASTGEKLNVQRDISNPDLERKIYYARWNITPLQFNLFKAAMTLIIVAGSYNFVRAPLIILFAFTTPIFISSLLSKAVNKRFNNFDRDYPDFIMSVVSRIKSGMNSFSAIQSSANGFDDSSLVKAEVALMLEKIRLGVQEEIAIGEFGETIPHPEIELFVQVLILNRRLGGNLSQTLERLAKQVRKRQEFRKKAVGAISMERGGAFFIALIMSGALILISFISPELLRGSFQNPAGQMIFQSGLLFVGLGFWIMRKVTEVKV